MVDFLKKICCIAKCCNSNRINLLIGNVGAMNSKKSPRKKDPRKNNPREKSPQKKGSLEKKSPEKDS